MSLKLNNTIYVSTISDLGGDMLKLDMLPGEYKLKEFLEGYILCTEEYNPNRNDLIKIFNTRDGNKGLGGTYHSGETNDENILRLFNDYIYNNLSKICIENLEVLYSNDDKVRCENSDGDVVIERDEIKLLPDYNNIPVIFYLNTKINKEDIHKISLELCNNMNKIGNVTQIFTVKLLIENNEYQNIGIMVQQENFFNLMGDQAGIALLHVFNSKARGLGNFSGERSIKNDSEVYYPYYEYRCSFKPCNCDVLYD